MERNGKLILHKFYRYLIPSILLVFAMQAGSLANGMIIGQFLDSTSLSAASLATAFIYLLELSALGLTPGVAIVVANRLSKKEFAEANKSFNAALVIGFLLSCLFIPVGLFATQSICEFLCGSFTEFIPLMRDYLSVFFYMSPLIYLGMLFCFLLSADNHPSLSSLYFAIASVVHIVTESLFCLYLPRDYVVSGVALSTGIGMLAGLVVLIPYFNSKKRLMKFSFCRFSFKDLAPVLKASVSSLASFFLLFLMTLLMSKTASLAFSDKKEMNSYVILSNMLFVFDVFIMGILTVTPIIVSTLLGEKDYGAIRLVIKRVILILSVVVSVLVLISLIHPQIYLLIFGVKESEVSSDYGLALRIYAVTFFVYTANNLIRCYYPSVFQNIPGLVNTFLKLGLFGIPLSMSLMFVYQVPGYSLGFLLAEILSLIATLLYVGIYGKKHSYPTLLLLPKSNDKALRRNLSVTNFKKVPQAQKDIYDSAIKMGANSNCATALSLCAEALLDTAFKHDYQKLRITDGCDVILRKEEETMVLSIKDGGFPFNPLAPNSKRTDSALDVIKKLDASVEYVRIISLNETTVKIPMNKESLYGDK